MITGFADRATADIYHGENSREARSIPRELWPIVRRKLDLLNAAKERKDLTVPPANRLERLKGDLAGFHSIRVNDQYRIAFRFEPDRASDVRVMDYHS